MPTIEIIAATPGSHYKVCVALSAELTKEQVQLLVTALQASYDDGTAGMFDVQSSDGLSVVTFERELSDDLEVIQTNLESGLIQALTVEGAVLAQLAVELELHQAESPLVQEIVATLKTADTAHLKTTELEAFREECSVLQDHLSNAVTAACVGLDAAQPQG